MLRIAHIATGNTPQKRERKLTERELLHREAIASIAARRIHNREKAEKLFAPEIKELNELRDRRDELRRMCKS